jgi:hypothetical protein
MAWPETTGDEPDLDYGDEPLDPSADEERKHDGLSFSTDLPPGAGSVDWSHVRESIAAHRILKGRNPDGSKSARSRIESDEADVTITEAGRAIDVELLPRSARGIAKRLKGWVVDAGHSRARYGAVLYQADSKAEGDESARHFRGDVRYPAEDREHFVLHARTNDGLVRFRVYYETRPKGDKTATAFTFAQYHDPVSGTVDCLNATDLNTWLDILVPPMTARKIRKTKDELLLEGGDWS